MIGIHQQGVTPLYVGLNPSPYHLVAALHHLLSSNDWFPLTLIIDDSLYAQSIRHAVHPVSTAHLFTKVICFSHTHKYIYIYVYIKSFPLLI